MRVVHGYFYTLEIFRHKTTYMYLPIMYPEQHSWTVFFTGLLDSGHEDFESGSDIYDAVGEMLLQGQETFTEESEIQKMCDMFYSTMIR